MNTNYFVLDEATEKIYGPYFNYYTASLVSDDIDSKCGACVSKINLDHNNHLIPVKRILLEGEKE